MRWRSKVLWNMSAEVKSLSALICYRFVRSTLNWPHFKSFTLTHTHIYACTHIHSCTHAHTHTHRYITNTYVMHNYTNKPCFQKIIHSVYCRNFWWYFIQSSSCCSKQWEKKVTKVHRNSQNSHHTFLIIYASITIQQLRHGTMQNCIIIFSNIIWPIGSVGGPKSLWPISTVTSIRVLPHVMKHFQRRKVFLGPPHLYSSGWS